MGKKPVGIYKILRKVEFFLLVLISLSLYFFFGKDTQETRDPVDSSSEKIDIQDFDSGKYSVVFDKKVHGIMRKMISEAKRSIYISTYTIRHNELLDLLQKRSSEGVQVNLAYGLSKDGFIPAFNAGLIKKKYGIFHSKYIVTDSNNVLITSRNLGSGKGAMNNAVLYSDVPQTAKILEKEVVDAINGKMPKRCDKGCDAEIGRVFFTPGKACVNIKKEFLKAKTKIEGAIYTVTTKNPVITGLKNSLRKNKIPVKLVVDKWKGEDGTRVNKRALNYFRSLGAEVKFDNSLLAKDPLFHHKFAVVDGQVSILGSLNWTSSGCYKNREIVVISKDKKIAEKFSEYFTTIWKD